MPPDFDPRRRYPVRRPHPRRPAGRVARPVPRPLERADVRGARLRGGDAESARLHRLRPAVRRPDQPRLGRQGVRGHHARRGRRGGAALRGLDADGRRRRLVRRLHGQLDQRPHRPLQGAGERTTATSTSSSLYGATEELWFPEWDLGGPPWENSTDYERWSPSRFAQNWRTPTLVIHGALDYRVPETEGMQTFTALQRQGVPVAASSTSPTRGTGSGSRRTRSCGGTRCRSGWGDTCIRSGEAGGPAPDAAGTRRPSA